MSEDQTRGRTLFLPTDIKVSGPRATSMVIFIGRRYSICLCNAIDERSWVVVMGDGRESERERAGCKQLSVMGAGVRESFDMTAGS